MVHKPQNHVSSHYQQFLFCLRQKQTQQFCQYRALFLAEIVRFKSETSCKCFIQLRAKKWTINNVSIVPSNDFLTKLLLWGPHFHWGSVRSIFLFSRLLFAHEIQICLFCTFIIFFFWAFLSDRFYIFWRFFHNVWCNILA